MHVQALLLVHVFCMQTSATSLRSLSLHDEDLVVACAPHTYTRTYIRMHDLLVLVATYVHGTQGNDVKRRHSPHSQHSTSCFTGKLLKADEASLHQTQAFQSPRGITETPPRAQRATLCGIRRHKYPPVSDYL